MRIPITFTALAVLAAAFASGCASTGRERSEHLADRIHGTVSAVDAYGTSRQASIESMNALVAEPLENLSVKFEAFNTSVNKVVSADGSLRDAVEAMKSSANARFKAWGQQNLSYTDDDMQVRAQASRAEARESFRKAVHDTDAMLEQSAGYVTYLSDFRKILSNDLTSKGVANVSDFAAKARVCNGKLDDMAKPTLASLGAAVDAMTNKATSVDAMTNKATPQ